MNKNYQSGRNFEHRVKKHLEQKGYYVMRSAGSKSPFDLIAVPMNNVLLPDVLLIQCKHGAKISKSEKKEIAKMNNMFVSAITCMVAWSKSHGQIEFYYTDKWISVGWI